MALITGNGIEMKLVDTFRYTVSLFFLVSCGGNGHRTSFPAPVPVVTRQIDFDGVYMQYPYRVKLAGDLIYITDLHAKAFFCHEYTFPAMKHQQSFARKGKAPGELVSVGNIIESNNRLYLLDVFAKKIFRWDGYQVAPYIDLPIDLGLYLDFTMYNDTTFIVPDPAGTHRLIFINNHGMVVCKMGTIPATERATVPQSALAQAWRPFIHYNPHNGVVAMVTQLGDVLEVYDLANEKTYTTIGLAGEPRCRYQGTTAIPNGIMGYSDVFVGDRYIYAVFWGHPLDKIKNGEITEEGGDMFRVFDLEGNPVKQYQLDRHITGFYVNEVTGDLIGTDVNNEQLVTFTMTFAK